EEAHDGGVDAGGHQAEGVAGGDEAVVRREVLEAALDDAGARQPGEARAERRAHGGLRVNEPQFAKHGRSTSGRAAHDASNCQITARSWATSFERHSWFRLTPSALASASKAAWTERGRRMLIAPLAVA